jgi:iron complex transport system substrate-binding protein
LKNLPLGFVVCILLSCSPDNKKTEGFKEVKDDLGRVIKVKSNPIRVMALSSSITEMLYLICPDSQIIARTQNCDYPTSILLKPVVNNYPIDYEKLLVMRPDLVFVKEGIISLEDADKIQSMGIPVFFQRYNSLEDVFSGLEEIGVVLNKKEKAQHVADSLRKEMLSIGSKPKVERGNEPTVLIIISLDQIFVFGKDSYASDIIQKAGGKNAMDRVFNNPFPQINTEYILQINPDLIFTLGEKPLDLKIRYPELEKLKAVQEDLIFNIDGDLISRPGPRLIDGIKIIHQRIEEYEK